MISEACLTPRITGRANRWRIILGGDNISLISKMLLLPFHSTRHLQSGPLLQRRELGSVTHTKVANGGCFECVFGVFSVIAN